ncbi:2-amino-4-hydroxy-6-hydroxymethyldihydropteridine diphosphokinase [Candidatus Woesearchaeota archaeon CG10_big_fil_rev_8_21_14_0_10_45_16]|nr:MAG: 2-amino-4-hydroxy-6-hydroxymethyldihydropteridine diphosphokinase [Candidatus Woesearchaeota archaeon CG10_big_fil_rev_8_21_14_0_10_45_16]
MILLSLGSNIDKEKNIAVALKRIGERCPILKKSSEHITEPVDCDGGLFLNMVIEIKTSLTPRELLLFTQDIEKRLGRTDKGKSKARTIDIDILFYHDQKIDEPGLTIPHPRLYQRRFVLEPLAEIAPGLVKDAWRS